VQAPGANPLQEAKSVSKCLDYLEGRGEFDDRKKYPFPSLIIANLRIGLEVLKWCARTRTTS